ncbi:hypothetical protein WMF28_01175 [Sorangium sp. So ce590]|uniref:hypothetical protein n=1 Tax=Sorangium sp. So ce590 TaxID=3133317 RepID=UPI003F5DA880
MDTFLKLRTRSVFVPGGQPHHTYVSRNEYGLEDEIRASTDNLCKLVTVTGPTKSGKSVLVKRVFPGNTAVWIDGGSVATEDDLWTQVIGQLAASTSTASTEETAKTTAGGIDVGGEVGLKLVGKVTAKASVLHSRASKSTTTSTRTSTHRAGAVAALQQSRRPLVIDDFYYIPEPLQATIIRDS